MRITLGALIVLFSCNQRVEAPVQNKPVEPLKSSNEVTEHYDTLTHDDFKNLFKYEELTTYNLTDSLELASWYKEPGRWSTKRVVVDSALAIIELRGQPISYKELNRTIARVTTMTEEDSQLKIIVWTVDRNLRIIGSVTLTSIGGDEGYGISTFGSFVSDTVFFITEQQTKYDSKEIETEYSHCFVFHADGTIEDIQKCH